jgi:hypothetical protein
MRHIIIYVAYLSLAMLVATSYVSYIVVDAMPPCPDCDVTIPDIRFCGYYDNENRDTPMDEGVALSSYYGKLYCDHGSERCTSHDDCTERSPFVKCLRECGPQL